MLPDQVRALPARPPSEVEWEDLLVRVEIAPRALRLAVEDAAGQDPDLVERLRTAVFSEAQLQHVLEATVDGREVADPSGMGEMPADAEPLVAEYGRLRFRSFVMVQRRGLNVWDWTVRGGAWEGVTTYQLFQAAALRDGALLAAVRGGRRQGAGA
jgi:hypothetical protein